MLRSLARTSSTRLAQFSEEVADDGEAFQRVDLQLSEVGGSGGFAVLFRLLFFVFLFGFFVRLFFANLVDHDAVIGVDEAVDHFVDTQLILRDLVGQREDFGDGGRAGGDGLDHVLEAVFDALGDLDFVLARQQIDYAHFAHVHAHGVGGAAEFGIHGGNGGFGFFRRIFVGDRRRGFVHDQRFGIRRDVAHRDAHVVDHAHHAFDLLDFEHFRQVVVDFGVGQVAAFLAQQDQRFQPCTARFDVLRGIGY